MRRVMTDAELKLWNELRAHRLMGLGFRRQVPIAGYIVDFACADKRILVEVDGSQHGDMAAAADDAVRTRRLEQDGWPSCASGTTTSFATSTMSASISSPPPG
jgi:very-short-patch-repair endonuclease